MSITPRKFLSYTLLPGVVPRMRAVFGEGFGFIPFCMANIFVMCRLLPANHPYLNPVNMGKYGVRHVLAQAAMNLQLRVRNIDQMIIFAIMLAGTVLLLLQCAFFIVASFVQVAKAQSIPLPTTFTGFFISPNPTQDISYMVMDRIFGIPGFFGSCVAQNIPCIDPTNMSEGAFPTPFHLALGNILAFYSYGVLLIGVFILLYYVVTIVSEMIMSGTPFGKRFNRVWAPLRIVVALGLLLPMNHNLNAAQYITLYVTKFGSALGTNAWNFYLTSMSTSQTLLGARDRLIARPQEPAVTDLMQFMTIAAVCIKAYKILYPNMGGIGGIEPYFVRNGTTPLHPPNALTAGNPRIIHAPSFITGATPQPYYYLQQWAGMGDIHLVYGHYDFSQPERYKEYKGGVRPYCGEIVLDTKRIIQPAAGNFNDGADWLSYRYLESLAIDPWLSGTFDNIADRINRIMITPADMSISLLAPVVPPVPQDVITLMNALYGPSLKADINTAYAQMIANADWINTAGNFGWAGAAIWYNKIAEHNGVFTDAVFNLPRVLTYPEIMEWIQEEKAKNNAQVTGKTRFDPLLSDKFTIQPVDERDKAILGAMNQAYKLWQDDPGTKPAESTNFFIDMIDAVFKQSGLWSFRDNENVHPLASLASLGRAMLINSVVSFGSASAAGIIGIMSGKGMIGGLLSGAASFMMTIAYIGLSVGIMLYYVVPFLPFIYFFFALVSWAKTIFEAMVGVPLWALAHLRYDGEGFPTRQSLYGYYLLIDIFLRPVLCVFGLIASIMIFYAMARTLNGIFNLVVSSVSGFDMNFAATATPGTVGSLEYFRNSLDKMFYTIIYAVIIYMIGMSSFKMIDQIPNHILRWMGGGAQSFGKMTERDSGREVASNVMGGSQVVGSQVSGTVGQLTRTKFVPEGDPD